VPRLRPSAAASATGHRPLRRRGLIDDPDAPLVPAELERWERRGGVVGSPLAIAVLIFFLEVSGLHVSERVAVPHHPHHFRTQVVSLVPEFWIGVALAFGMLVAVRLGKRQLLALFTVFEGLVLASFGIEFAAPFVVFGIWLMLRASRRTRQLAARGELPRQKQRAKEADSGGDGRPSSANKTASKRYTPPKHKRRSPSSQPSSVRVGRGGRISGELPRRSSAPEEKPRLMRLFEPRSESAPSPRRGANSGSVGEGADEHPDAKAGEGGHGDDH
jgi:hypothetical protein